MVIVIPTSMSGTGYSAAARPSVHRKVMPCMGLWGMARTTHQFSKNIDHGYPGNGLPPNSFGRPHQTPTQNFFSEVRAVRACRADAMPRMESRRTASVSPAEHPGTGPPPAAARPKVFLFTHPEIGANPHENRSHHQPQTAF